MTCKYPLAATLAAASILSFASPSLASASSPQLRASTTSQGGFLYGEKGDGPDCNKNGVPDNVDIQNGFSDDCNNDGIPDECPACPPVDVVFIMDTSGSMGDEGNALCTVISGVVSDLQNEGIQVNATFLGITATPYSCLTDTVVSLLGTSIPGSPPSPNLSGSEDWGGATAVVADRFSWTPGSLRVIVPISDEGSYRGDPSTSQDTAAITNAIAIANANNVTCSPISGTGSSDDVITQASNLAAGTGGLNFISTNPDLDLAGAISMLLTDACIAATDCNKNGIPDECENDSNFNGVPDDCDEGNSELDCAEFNRYELLTPNDTLTLLTNFHNPGLEMGYLQVIAVDEANNPIGFDHLIGHSLVIDGFNSLDYSLNPVDYRAAVAQGALTDVDGDGTRDLNGIEYERTAGKILIPRFFATSQTSDPRLLLISLAGGRKFDTTIDFLVANDNEVVFSTEHTFRCWDRVALSQISALFSDEFLADHSGSDPLENIGGLESGWISMDGGVANSTASSIPDPAFYAVYIDRLSGTSSADLPFETCLQSGHLLSNTVNGDNEEIAGEAQQDCGVVLPRRQPGSFLLYPEFDNASGKLTLITVTNTDASESVTAHFVYIGRFGQ